MTKFKKLSNKSIQNKPNKIKIKIKKNKLNKKIVFPNLIQDLNKILLGDMICLFNKNKIFYGNTLVAIMEF